MPSEVEPLEKAGDEALKVWLSHRNVGELSLEVFVPLGVGVDGAGGYGTPHCLREACAAFADGPDDRFVSQRSGGTQWQRQR